MENNEILVENQIENFIPAPEGFLYTNTDENHKLIIMNQVDAQKLKLPLVQFERAYNDDLYEKGYAPAKPVELCQEEVRSVRNKYLEQYVDPIVSNPLRWADLSKKTQQLYIDYRLYLLNYTEQENWWLTNPFTFEEWEKIKK